jgi:hypothetical protein
MVLVSRATFKFCISIAIKVLLDTIIRTPCVSENLSAVA